MPSFQYGLTWAQARSLLAAGAYVRRELWTDRKLFLTSGGLVWVDAAGSQRVVQGADFGRAEFLAKDWTNMGFDQNGCIKHPGWTEIAIDETATVQVNALPQLVLSAGGAYGANSSNSVALEEVSISGGHASAIAVAAVDLSLEMKAAVPARTVQNWPSWGEPWIGPDGNRVSNWRVEMKGILYWVNPGMPFFNFTNFFI